MVETGTYVGNMVEASRRYFERVYTIELNSVLTDRAKKRFSSAANVQVLQGDSGRILADLVPTLQEPALFWPDAHYSAGITARGHVDTPILDELRMVLTSTFPHVCLIDDARHFGTDPSYPTIDELRQLVHRYRPDWCVAVETDIIQITPK